MERPRGLGGQSPEPQSGKRVRNTESLGLLSSLRKNQWQMRQKRECVRCKKRPFDGDLALDASRIKCSSDIRCGVGAARHQVWASINPFWCMQATYSGSARYRRRHLWLPTCPLQSISALSSAQVSDRSAGSTAMKFGVDRLQAAAKLSIMHVATRQNLHTRIPLRDEGRRSHS